MNDLVQLCERIRHGDPLGAEDLYRLLRSKLLKMFRSQRPNDAEDILQAVAARLVTKIQEGKIEHPEFLVTYAGRAARNAIAEAHRREKSHAKIVAITDATSVHVLAANQLDDLLARERCERLRNAIDRLSTSERELMRLTIQGLKTEQIAERMNLPEGTIRGKRIRVIQKLRARLKQAA